MAPIATKSQTEVIGTARVPLPDYSEETLESRVHAYLAAWRIGGEEWLRDCSHEIMSAVGERLAREPSSSPERMAIEEADRFVNSWLTQFVPEGAAAPVTEGGIPLQSRLAVLYGIPPNARLPLEDRVQAVGAMRQGLLNSKAARTVTRPPETRAMRMQTSLSRLPSTRIIAGWFLLAALLFVVFLLTH